MFEPVHMSRLRLVILERDERAVLRHLGRAGVVQLTHSPAGPDTAPLPPCNRGGELARLEQLSSRLENFRRRLELPSGRDSLKPDSEIKKGEGANESVGARRSRRSSGRKLWGTRELWARWTLKRPEGAVSNSTSDCGFPPPELSLDQAEKSLNSCDEQCGHLLQRRQQLQQRLAELAAVSEQMADYREVELPLDQPDASSFLHFVTGSLPARNFEKLETGGNVAVLPLARKNGRQLVIAMTTRQGRPELDRSLQHAGFEPETLPVVAGATSAGWAGQNRREQEQATGELEQLDPKLKSLVEKFRPTWAQIEDLANLERRLLEAEQHFPRTESSVLVTGWAPSADALALARGVREITNGRCAIEATAAEKIAGAEVPVLLRHPRWLRPFALLVTAYGLPKYRELEPTLFVAVSYLLMFGLMFGDAGHGCVLALAGLILRLTSRRATLRQVGVLLMFAGGASILSGAIYGSYFGLEQFKQYALWHDPLAGDPARLMLAAIDIGIVMISLGLLLNIFNHLRHGEFVAALLDKFGAAGVVFYWSALVLFTKSAALQARGLWTPAIWLLLVAPVIGWLLKEPIEIWLNRGRGQAGQGGIFGVAMESLVSAFEALLSYFANTVSFVRLAAYAMSHAALLLAAFMIANDVKHLAFGGNLLSVVVIILGNVVAIVLEGIVAAVQALRLEYYEFFGKFFSGGGQPFVPFRLQTTPVADSPL